MNIILSRHKGKGKTTLLSIANRESVTGGLRLLRYMLMLLMMMVGVYVWGQTTISDVEGLNAMTATGSYKITKDFDATGYTANISNFSGTLTAQANADGTYPVISGLRKPLFNSINGGTVSNIMFKDITVSGSGPIGAICGTANGATRIYNCGILPTTTTYDDKGNITGFTGSSVSSSNGYCGSLVGLLDGTNTTDKPRVINCFSYANITGGTTVAGIVGYNNYASDASKSNNAYTKLRTMVVNCMFYGDITGGNPKYPVYGGSLISNEGSSGINTYTYFRKGASFDDAYTAIEDYNRSWPAEEKDLVRFEYYRSILNSNRRLCTWWVNGTDGTAPSDANITSVGIAKWVIDPTIAPYPILKKWGKYPSIINQDPDKVWNPRTKSMIDRSSANAREGRSTETLKVVIKGGSNNGSAPDVTKDIPITDMDTLNYDYCAKKIQLPYYNEVFGNPNGATWVAKYGNNYTNKVVTGWKITSVTDSESFTGTRNNFTANWESGYNFADRHCTDKDLFDTSGRVFAQGGYYYVPEGVTKIEIEAYWGDAVYLQNRGNNIDRVSVTKENYKNDKAFAPAGMMSTTFQDQPVYNDWQAAIQHLNTTSATVYDQAIVLIGNHQVKNGNKSVGKESGNDSDNLWHPHTIMSVDLDFDNEPDYCFQLQFRSNYDRPPIQPIRWDFLPVVELGMAVRHNQFAYAIGIFIPQGHFEITETAFMRTTQIEWDASITRFGSGEWPVILNGGEHKQMYVRKAKGNRTTYFLVGGHTWFERFAPGSHPNSDSQYDSRLCAINAIGGDFPEFYLSGLYRPDKTPGAGQGNPHCYIDGGHFGIVAGSGYEKVNGSVTFKIDNAVIREFYGGGINGAKPVGGSIDVTINHSMVDKYCGGPKVGSMTSGTTVSTSATGTTFGIFYGGGNGGNSYYRQLQRDGDFYQAASGNNPVFPIELESSWGKLDNGASYNWAGFKPLAVYDATTDNKGYHAEFEFEDFQMSNGVDPRITRRTFIRWIQFGTTNTGNVTNTLSNCTINTDFFGGGNLGGVTGTVNSTLTNTTVMRNAFGAGFSAAIPTFQVHDKTQVTFPSQDFAGIITEGSLKYDPTVYKWTNDKPSGVSTSAPTFQDNNGKWYCYTPESLLNLGAVEGNVTLTLEGNTTVNGSVYGGGDASAVGYVDNSDPTKNIIANTTVILQGNTKVHGNVFGGGNHGEVSGTSKVEIK